MTALAAISNIFKMHGYSSQFNSSHTRVRVTVKGGSKTEITDVIRKAGFSSTALDLNAIIGLSPSTDDFVPVIYRKNNITLQILYNRGFVYVVDSTEMAQLIPKILDKLFIEYSKEDNGVTGGTKITFRAYQSGDWNKFIKYVEDKYFKVTELKTEDNKFAHKLTYLKDNASIATITVENIKAIIRY